MSGATPADDNRSCSCPSVVMILASLKSRALDELLLAAASVPALAFVLMPAEGNAGAFPPALGTHAPLAIVDACHGSRIEAGRLYVVPPDRQARVQGDALLVSDSRGERESAVDGALRSLALEQGGRAAAVVLSGAADGGLQGLRSVKAHGGTVIVQDPATAECPEMPRSVIDAGLADFVMAPGVIPSVLANLADPEGASAAASGADDSAPLPETVQRILELLYARKKCDFRRYRHRLLLRRIRRRAALRNVDHLADYARYVELHPDEVDALYKDLLIGVTSFFRDPAVFDLLTAEVLPELLRRSSHVRVWVVGCATGQEAYSIAMLLTELTGDGHGGKTFRIFATDIDAASLETARLGTYPASIASEVTEERLKRFFYKVNEREYRIVKELRSSIVFAKHNLISDPPFSNMDLISCRHLLIYLKPDVQERLLPVFDFALNPGGYLLLSPAEYPAGAQAFSAMSLKQGVHRKTAALPGRDDGQPRAATPRLSATPPAPRAPRGAEALLRKALLEHCLPASVLVNAQHEILAVEGPLVSYLEFPPGAMSCNLLKLARRGLRGSLALACRKAARSGEVARDDTARVKRDGRYAPCSVVVRPMPEPATGEPLLLVVFRDREDPYSHDRPADQEAGSLVRHLEEELETTRAELNAAIQELVRTNEELRASNIEIMSMNEELKSTNDELETFKEELLSLNEELSLVNGQLRDKLEELDTANSDMANLLAASDIATVFLDSSMSLKRFTPSAATLFKLSAADVGRPFRELALQFPDTSLEADCNQVLATLAPSEEEVASQARRWYLRRVLPYRTAEGALGGLVITYVDITTRIEAEARARLLAGVLLDSEEAVIARSFDGRISAWNRGAETMYGYTEAEARELNFEALVPEDLHPSISKVAERIARGETVQPFETQRRARDGQILDVWVMVTVMRDEEGRPIGLATIERDVTARRQAEFEAKRANVWLERQVRRRTAALERSEYQLRAILDSAVDAIVTIDARGTIKSVNDAVTRIFGYSPGELVGKNVKVLMPSPTRGAREEHLGPHGRAREARIIGTRREVTARRKDGTEFPAELSVRTVPRLNLYTTWIRDLSERNALHEEILHIAALEQRRIGQELHDTVQQELAALSLLAANFAEGLDRDDAHERRATAERIAEEIHVLQELVHSLAEGLVPLQIPADGLGPALRALAERTTKTHGIDCRVDVPSSVVVESDVAATHLFRIAQEAVTNSVRHANAKSVLIRLALRKDELELGVEDDGQGIRGTSTETPGRGLGLRIIKYRSALIGGTLRVEGRENGGTRVVCRMCAERTKGKKGNGRTRVGKISRERC